MSGQVATDANRASSSDAPRVTPAALAAFVKRALEAAGLSSENADIVAGLMVCAAAIPTVSFDYRSICGVSKQESSRRVRISAS